jgi:hypothetical protein
VTTKNQQGYEKNRKIEKQKNRKTVTNILCLAHLTKAVAGGFSLKSFQKRLAIESFLKICGTEQKYVKFLSPK